MSYSRKWKIAAVILIVAVLVSASILLVSNKPPNDNSNLYLDRSGVHAGDVFTYTLNGMYNDTPVTGTVQVDATSDSSYGSQTISFSNQELNSTFWDHSPLDLFGSGTQTATGKYMTPFGVKEVVWMFRVTGGWAMINYVGANPGISYGSSVNGPNVHLSLVLTSTTNQWVGVNNTQPLNLQPKIMPTEGSEGGMGGIDPAGATSGMLFYSKNGVHLNYSLNATDVDVMGFSEGNVRSMAERGPFAYDLNLYMVHANRTTGSLEMPAGYYFIYFIGHTKTAESIGSFH